MTRSYRIVPLIGLVTLSLFGCAKSSHEEPTGKAAIAGINAIVDAPNVTFNIEEHSLGSISFGEVSAPQRYDDLSYDFNFDIKEPGASSSRRLGTEFVDVVRDTNYLFVLSGSLASPQMTLWSNEERKWTGNESVLELGFLHLNNSTGPLDVYLAAPGVNPAPGNAFATLAPGERLAPTEVAAGQYVLTLTTAGDPNAIVFQSSTRILGAGTSDTILILDRNPSRTADVFVRQLTQAGSASDIADARMPPTGRFLHAAPAIGSVDIAENGDFNSLRISNQPYGNFSADTDLTVGTNDYTWTDAGNMGATLIEHENIIPAGHRTTLVLAGSAAEPVIINFLDERRSFSNGGRLNLVNAAKSFTPVDVYLLASGESLADRIATTANVPFTYVSGMTPVVAGSYQLTITKRGEKNVLAGPVDIDIANRDVIDLFIMDTADPNTLSILLERSAP